ncbi:MAG: hypothetical protein ACF8R7_18220 [Phycisphaerales bacterium JB039]
MFRYPMRAAGAATAIVCAGAAATPALAVELFPGGSVTLPGGSIAGTVVRDALVPFRILDAGGQVLLSGNVQDRVLRTSSGELAFVPRIRDVVGPGAFGIEQVVRDGFTGFSTDVNYSATGLGSAVPTSCARSGDGDDLDYSFAFAPIFSQQESKFFWADTDGETFGLSGSMTIRLQNGRSTTITVAAPVVDTTPPDVAITAPGPFECGCNPMEIRGTILDDESDIESWTLDYARDAAGPWMTIATGTPPVGPDGVIALWDTTGLSQGDYFLRVRAENGAGMTSQVTSAVFVDTSFQNVELRVPDDGGLYGGRICFDGTAWDRCPDFYRVDWRPAGAGSFQPVDSSMPTYPGTVINDPLATWEAGSLADGDYQVRLRGQDACGNTESVVHDITIDNTPPVAEITAPGPCTYQCDDIVIRGTASDANLRRWSLQYTGGDERGWREIASGTTSVVDDVLAVWDASGLRPCAYTIRLVVDDEAVVNCVTNHDRRDRVSINVGAYADCDGNGTLDFFDFLCFQNAFAAGCP